MMYFGISKTWGVYSCRVANLTTDKSGRFLRNNTQTNCSCFYETLIIASRMSEFRKAIKAKINLYPHNNTDKLLEYKQYYIENTDNRGK